MPRVESQPLSFPLCSRGQLCDITGLQFPRLQNGKNKQCLHLSVAVSRVREYAHVVRTVPWHTVSARKGSGGQRGRLWKGAGVFISRNRCTVRLGLEATPRTSTRTLTPAGVPNLGSSYSLEIWQGGHEFR